MKTGFLFLNLLLFSCIVACSAKVHPVTNENIKDNELTTQRLENLVINVEQDIEKDVVNKNAFKNDPDSLKVLEQYSVYREYYKQGNLIEAYPFWTWIFLNAPAFRKTTYIDGAEIFIKFIGDEKDASRKNQLIDSLMLLYDTRIKHFGEEGFVLGRKGSDLFRFKPAAYEEAYKYLQKSIELEGSRSAATTTFYYIYATTFMKKDKKISEEILVENFLTTNDIVQTNMANDPNWEAVFQNILVLVKDYLECDMLVSNFGKLFKQNRDNLPVLKKYQTVLDVRGCMDNSVFIGISERIFELEPSAEAANSLARYFLSKDNYSRAVFYFERAIENEKDNIVKARYALNLAETYRRSNNFPAARSSAQRAISFNPEDGTPHILIGDLYVSSAANCGNTPFERKTIYWAAVDQYAIARNKGAADAAERVRQFSQHFPSKEEAFYQDPPIRENDSYTIGCWINVTTNVRFTQ